MKQQSIWLVTVGLLFSLLAFMIAYNGNTSEPVRIGVIHAQTGLMSLSEAPLIRTIEMAVDELNESGGVLGRRVEIVSVDSRSDPDWAAIQADRLITEEGVEALFGCWTSRCRRALLPVLERHNHLLFYPLQYEGLEESPYIMYMGMVPNQQTGMSLNWMREQFGNRIALVGSDYEYPRLFNAQLSALKTALGFDVTAEYYLPLDASVDAQDDLIEKLAAAPPDFVVNTINGAANGYFFKRINERFAELSLVPPAILSLSIGEVETTEYAPDMTGSFVVWGYMQSVDTPENKAFLDRFHRRFGRDAIVSDPMQTSYAAVKLWAQAAQAANSVKAYDVYSALGTQSMRAPEGIISVDASNLHLWRMVRIGQVQVDGSLKIIVDSGRALPPNPFLMNRSKPEWVSLKAEVLGG